MNFFTIVKRFAPSNQCIKILENINDSEVTEII